MKKIYFNHGLLIDSSDPGVIALIVEIAGIKEALGSISLCVSEDFLSLRIQSGELRSFLAKRGNQDKAIVLILALMNNGPHFHRSNVVPHLVIVPGISEGCFAFALMQICFNDNQEHVLSLKNEKILVCAEYKLSSENRSQDILNLVGKEKLLRHLENCLSFNSIDEVFQEIIKTVPAIEILDSARKSAKKHHFKGAFVDVYKTVCNLKSEMSLLIAGIPDRKRIEAFFHQTGFEISGESDSTLGNPKYRRHREFTIESKGKVLCDWHIKIGNETRIHYFIDKENEKIYIAHCGSHLPSPSYRS
ncbi:MAG: hypothetical protein NT166_24865 [Candidatus Aminicenantes bacterium]|nr:hypothetical protein [Candidatus Aminicenantes bacterium]